MMLKLLATGCAIFCLSTAAFAGENGNNGRCSGKKCGGKEVGPMASGDRPLVMEPKDNCKGTVKCVNSTRYPTGNKTEMTLDTQDGEKKVIMDQRKSQHVQPGDQVEVQGRYVEANGEKLMMGEQMHRSSSANSNNLNPKVKSSKQNQSGKKSKSNNGRS